MVQQTHSAGVPKWVSFTFSVLFAWAALISVIGCTARRVKGVTFEEHHINAWHQVWKDAANDGKFVWATPGEPLTSISGTFILGPQKAQILYRLTSYPRFDDGTIIYQNEVMPIEAAMERVRIQYGLDPERLEMWKNQMWDHNGAFKNQLDEIMPSFLDAKIHPSIKWGYCLSGHGGGADKQYTAGMIRIHTFAEGLFRAGHTSPDFLEIESCNGDGTVSVPKILAADGIFPKRLAFTPCGFPTTAYHGSIARRAGLESEQRLFQPVYYQWGWNGWGQWVLQRLNVEPLISAQNTTQFMVHTLPDILEAGASVLGGHKIELPGIREALTKTAIEMVTPEIINNSDHEFVLE